MKTLNYNAKHRHNNLACHQDELNGSPIATVSAAQPVLQTAGCSIYNRNFISPMKKIPLTKPPVSNGKVRGIKNYPSAYDMSTTSPCMSVRKQPSPSVNQSSYQSYLQTHEYERQDFSTDTADFQNVQTPHGLTMISNKPFKPQCSRYNFDNVGDGGAEISDDYLGSDGFEDSNEESDSQAVSSQKNFDEQDNAITSLTQQRSAKQFVKESKSLIQNYNSLNSHFTPNKDRKPQNNVVQTVDYSSKGLGLRKGSNIQSTNVLDKSCLSSQRQTPQSALSRKPSYRLNTNPSTLTEQGKSERTAVYKSNPQIKKQVESVPSSSTADSICRDTLRASKIIRTGPCGAPQVRGLTHRETFQYHQRKQSACVLPSGSGQQKRNFEQRNQANDLVNKTSSYEIINQHSEGIGARHGYIQNDQNSQCMQKVAVGNVIAGVNGLNNSLNSTSNISSTFQQNKSKRSPFVKPLLPNNCAVGILETANAPVVPTLTQTQKQAQCSAADCSSKKKKRKRTPAKRGGNVSPSIYSMPPNQQFLPAYPTNNMQKTSSLRTTDCRQKIDCFPGGFKKIPDNNENQQRGFPSSSKQIPLRSSSNNKRHPEQQQHENAAKKKMYASKTSSFVNPSGVQSKALSQIVNQSTTNQGAQGKRILVVPSHQQNVPVQNYPAKKKQWSLLDSERQTYGDRIPKGYEKIDLLGKGGCAVVWLGKQIQTGELVALKQFPKTKHQCLDSTARIEVAFGRQLFPKLSIGKTAYGLDPLMFPGIMSIAKLIDDIEDHKDYWLVYEVGSSSLGKHLYDVKGEFFKGERIYHVQHQAFYQCLKQNTDILRVLIQKMAQIFQVLSEYKIVHADIKPDNILVKFDGYQIKDVKLIDFGSAFSYQNPSSIQASTPEYLSPEVLDYLENRALNTMANGTNSGNLCKKLQPWSYDIWSLGAILLEILTGFPLWLSLKGRVSTPHGKSIIGNGMFGVQGREAKKILQKQYQIIKNIPAALKKYDCSNLDRDPDFMDLLYRMLDFNPIRRISPSEILVHPFVACLPSHS